MNDQKLREEAKLAFNEWQPKAHPEINEDEYLYEEYSNGLIEGWFEGYLAGVKSREDYIKKLVQSNLDQHNKIGFLSSKVQALQKQLTNAKELLKQWLQTSKANGCDNVNIVADTEQFLNSEVQK